jgi:integrase
MISTYTRDVTPQTLHDIFDRFRNTPTMRNHLIILTKAIFKYAYRHGLITHNPAAGFELRTFESRDRVLSDAEIKQLWDSATTPVFGTIVKLLILTGQRRSEIQHLILQGETAHLPAQYSKNKKAHTFPITPRIAELLKRNRTYSGWSKGKKSLAPIDDFRLHDIRRYYATTQASLGTPPHIIERILNHQQGTISPIARIYNHHTYLPEMRDAVERFDAHISALLQLHSPGF